MGRRETLARAIKLRQQKQRAPAIIVLPPYACSPAGEPVVTWALDRRTPTEAELVAAIVAAGFTEQQANATAAKIVGRKPFTHHPKPGSIHPAEHKETK